MVFDSEAVFQQFLHCKFREHVVRLLLLPNYHYPKTQKHEEGPLFLAVTKWGNVGLLKPSTMGLLHTFCLDLENQNLPLRPKCQRSHLIVDAVVAQDIRCVIFATTKGILQCYDTGELDQEDLGLDILPRGQFNQMTKGSSPLPPRDFGFVETHRIHMGLESVPTVLSYYTSKSQSNSKLLIGHVDGVVSILEIGKQTRYPFAGKRKVRGSLIHIKISELRATNQMRSYRGHTDPVQDIQFLGGNRNLILSASRDVKFSLFCEDYTGISESFIISLPKGINTLAHSESLNIIVTGSEDGIVRIFSQFSMKMPQMELQGHRAAIVGLALLPIPFSESEILLSYSEDVELRAWDPVKFACLQSIYIRFPGGALSSTIMCKTSKFANQPLMFFQIKNEDKTTTDKLNSKRQDSYNSSIFLLYCNSYAKLDFDRNDPTTTRAWPFDFDMENLILDETKMKTNPSKTPSRNRNPKSLSLDKHELTKLETTAVSTMNALMKQKYYNNVSDRKSTSKRSNSLTTLSPSSLAASASHHQISLLPMEQNRSNLVFDKLSFHEIESIVCPPEPKYYVQ